MEKEYMEKEARILYDKNDVKAFQAAVKGRNHGHAKCTYILAACYLDGLGVKKDEEYANKLFDESFDGLMVEALENDAVSQGFIGEFYRYGIGTKTIDLLKAIEWYTKAANEGIAECKFFLGELYGDKHNSFYNSKESLKWYDKAARQGLPIAIEYMKKNK